MGYQAEDEDDDNLVEQDKENGSDEARAAADDGNLVMADKENGDDQVDVQKDADPVANAPKPALTQSPDAKSQAIRDMLSQKYGAASDPAALAAARDKEKTLDSQANMSHGISQMLMAGSVASGGPGASEADYQTALKQAHMPVAQAEEDRANQIKDFLNQQNLGRQSDSDLQKQKLWQVENDTNDPGSKKSQMAVHLFESQFPDALKGWTDDEKSQLSAADIAKLAMPGQEKMAQLKMAQEMARNRMAIQQQGRQDKLDAKDKSVAVNDLKGLRDFLDNERQSGRSGLGVANQKVDNADRVMASVDIDPTNPDQIAMIRKSKKDPKALAALAAEMDKKTPQQYMEIVNGLLSTIAPGAGGLGQLEHLRADTAEQQKAKIQQFFDSNPHPAGMGATIVNNLQTLLNERDTSQAKIDQHTAKAKASFPRAFVHDETKGDADAMLNAYMRTPASPPPSDVASGGGKPPPHGPTVTQGGHTYTWNGAKYVPASSVAVGGR